MTARFKTKSQRPLAVLTAYDAPGARTAAQAGLDWLLVGDSVAQVVHGLPSTRAATLDMICLHTRAVRRGARRTPLIADVPYPTVRLAPHDFVRQVRRLLTAGADAVKIEWASRALSQTERLVHARIPVMGHVGLTPQDVRPGSAFRLRGSDPVSARRILDQAVEFERRGALAVFVECVPESLGKEIAECLRVPVIGIGAGRFCDGQVLVFHDAVGLTPEFGARFVKRFADTASVERAAIRRYVREVKNRAFPAKKNVYGPLK